MAPRKRKAVGQYIAERLARGAEFAEGFDKLQLARKMKELREKAGLSQAELARTSRDAGAWHRADRERPLRAAARRAPPGRRRAREARAHRIRATFWFQTLTTTPAENDIKKDKSAVRNKSAADFAEAAVETRNLYEFLTECAGSRRFGQRGASFSAGGKVVARLELRGCPRAVVDIDDDVLWVSLENAVTKNLPPAAVQNLKDVLIPLAANGTVNLHIPVRSLSRRNLDEVRKVFSHCFRTRA